jgi:predicted amidohydrolase YtcJ
MNPTLYTNAAVVTCDRVGTIATALVIADGRILAVGDEDDVRAAAGPRAQRVDLEGATVLPGFIDTHPQSPTPANTTRSSSASPSAPRSPRPVSGS